MSRTTKYSLCALAVLLLATAVAYVPNISPPGLPNISQQASHIQASQLQDNIAHALPTTSIPTPLPTTRVLPTRAAMALPQPSLSDSNVETPALDDDMQSGSDLSATLALSATLPVTPSATLAPTDEPLKIVELGGQGPGLRGQFVVQTEQLDFYAGPYSFSPAQLKELAPRIEAGFRLAESRFGEQIYHRISLGYYYPTQRNLRGMAFTDQRRAELYYRSDESMARAIAPAVHELAHHLQEQRYGHAGQVHADTILLEGGATWIAGDSWLPMCGASTWKERARKIRDMGVPLELTRAERYGANNAYELWASFVDFLLDNYGSKTYRALYFSGRGRALGSADYQGVTGKSLDQLTQEWRVWIDQ